MKKYRQQDPFEFELDQLLASAVMQCNGRDDTGASNILGSVQVELSQHFKTNVSLCYGGSVLKDTYVEGLSDIDALFVFEGADIAHLSPADVRIEALACLRARYGTSVVTDGVLALTLNFPDMELQLLPAVEQEGILKIGSKDGKQWSIIQPHTFANNLVRANNLMNGKLLPIIKLAKLAISNLPKPQRLQSYHIEVLAIAVFSDYTGRNDLKTMFRYFFDQLASAIKVFSNDVTGQSQYADAYLGDLHSRRRRICIDAASRISGRIRNADSTRSIELWRGLFSKKES